MRTIPFLLLTLACSCSLLCARKPRLVTGRPLKGGFLHKLREHRPDKAHVESLRKQGLAQELSISQPLDHFNASETRTWQQLYYVNTDKAAGTNVNFLHVGGESGITLDDVTNYDTSPGMYAEQFGATIYALEHRYYGKSRPTPDQTIPNLQYLNSRQAIEDIAAFISYINGQSPSNCKPKWILFGGSYAGSLALWFRELHPELANGAVGSSATLEARLDFFGFMEQLEQDVRHYNAGEPRVCNNDLGYAFDSIEELLQTKEGRQNLTDRVNVTPHLDEVITDENDIADFYKEFLNDLIYAAQFEGRVEMSHLCDLIDHPDVHGDYLSGLIAALGMGGDEQLNISYEEDVQFMHFVEWNDEVSDARSFAWQVCTEFGWWQSTDTGTSVFRATNPNNVNINYCFDIFGVTVEEQRDAIDSTNDYYGGNAFYTGTNVVMTNGAYDPWSALAIKQSLDNTTIAFSIYDGIHIVDMMPAGSDKNVLMAQNITRINIDKWINGPPNPITKRDIPDNSGMPPIKAYVSQPTQIIYTNKHEEVRLKLRKEYNTQLKASIHHQRPGLIAPPPKTNNIDTIIAMTEGTITQVVNHFDKLDRRTFQQRFLKNDQWATPTGPNFLIIGDQSPAISDWVTNGDLPWLQYAKEVGATVYLLEHRYYGASKTGTNDLTFLTSSQMLYDVASFIDNTKSSSSSGPWITFGASYAGALSAWAREWFPERIAGAVASSAPVTVKLDFYEHLLGVEKALRAYSETCANRTQLAFDSIRALAASTEGRLRISQLFRLYPSWSDRPTIAESDLHQVFRQIYLDFQVVAENGGVNNALGSQTIDVLCSFMMADKDIIAALADVHNWRTGAFSILDSSADNVTQTLKNMVAHIDNETYDSEVLAELLWTWQTCNEFGYFESTDYGRSLFGATTPINYFVKICEGVFGKTMDQIFDSVSNTNYQYGYGGKHYKGSNVVLTQGTLDPWSVLGLYSHPDPSVVSVLIEGEAHCSDIYPARDTDNPSLRTARDTVLSNIKQWIR